MTASLVFQNTAFDVVDNAGQPWLKAADIARALGYAREDSVSRIYERNADEFSGAMSQTVNLTVCGEINGLQHKTIRIFSLRGAHLIAMFARTKVAKAFRRWVLDVLDKVVSGDVVVNPKTTADERSPLRAAVSLLVGKRSLMYPEAYALVHQRFGVEHIDQLTSEQATQAVEYVHRLALEGEVLPADRPQKAAVWLSETEAFNLAGLLGMLPYFKDVQQKAEKVLRAAESPLAPGMFDAWHEPEFFCGILMDVRERCKPVQDRLSAPILK
ncbi:BRO-N domain-containing protein [Laribacter hongkongensis]|uniref:BRO-N domain-containing protein n=1 Tax=Laribacter hongkongensis TaxID=168471 RepID=UPI001EFE9D6B|nr:BRO family protein [Laribacter hongkongensis]MCG9081520.1 hypothetical protein [Laribacter hongkongensis]